MGIGAGGGALDAARPAAAMVLVEFIFSALQIFIKLALDDGMDERVLVAYRLMFGAAFLCPVAFLLERCMQWNGMDGCLRTMPEEKATTNHEGGDRVILVWTFRVTSLW